MSQEKKAKREFKSASELEKTIEKMFHDLKSCTGVAYQASEIVKEYILETPNSDNKEKETMLELISAVHECMDKQIKIMESTVEDLYVNPRKISLSVVNFKQFLDDIYGSFNLEAEKKNIKLMENYSHLTNLKFKTDINLMTRVLQNVISNAIKYTDAGFIELSCKYVSESSEALIKVRDTGIGIPKADLEHVFEYGSRASNVGEKEGTGLGFNTVKESVEKLGGNISIDSKVNFGTTVYINIPLKLVE